MLHHLSCVATLCLLTFTIYDTGALQPMLFFAHTVLLFETLEVGGCISVSMTLLTRVCVVGPTRAACNEGVLLQASNIRKLLVSMLYGLRQMLEMCSC